MLSYETTYEIGENCCHKKRGILLNYVDKRVYEPSSHEVCLHCSAHLKSRQAGKKIFNFSDGTRSVTSFKTFTMRCSPWRENCLKKAFLSRLTSGLIALKRGIKFSLAHLSIMVIKKAFLGKTQQNKSLQPLKRLTIWSWPEKFPQDTRGFFYQKFPWHDRK